MVAPLLPYAVKGVIWFQGESNTSKPQEYQQLFSAVITDWRKQWQRPTMPFLYVQLANFMATKPQPSESNWAELREAQRQTLQVPNTGMAVAIDVGEWNDIHPLDKETVGKRLAIVARKVTYGEKNLVASGPHYESMQVQGNKMVLRFTSVGSGLVAKGGPLAQFAIAGADKKFVWAQARIEGNTVVVWSDQVPAPVAVRYAWADNPEGANLYNKEGLPASPFQATVAVASP
jgi:sialate O-acetylesterase